MTRYGGQTLDWLTKRGWTKVSLPPGVMGDPRVTDPMTGDEMDVYTAAKKQKERTGEYPEFLKDEKDEKDE
jgi:hypothetical protein